LGLQRRFRIRTKIICTIGPSSSSIGILEQLARAGMDVARINFSHGTYEEHLQLINHIRKVSENLSKPIAILQDIPGPKIRIGRFKEGSVQLRQGSTFTLSTKPIEGDETKVTVNYGGLPKDVKVNDVIFLADGSIKLQVVKKGRSDVRCKVLVGGELLSGKGANIPEVRLKVPALTKHDVDHVSFGLEHGVDFLALSFVRAGRDVEEARSIIKQRGGETPIIAKIESKEAIENLDSILEASDGAMVARGDLGVEMNVEKVPMVQKKIIEKCNRLGKPVITATQMLESMVKNRSPTRAEVTDVANAILDGTDAVMLSEETAVGRFPVEAVEVLSKVASATEAELPFEQILNLRKPTLTTATEDVICFAACETASALNASAIVAPTRTGLTARRVSKYRPKAPIVALTPNEGVVRQLVLWWGIHPIQIGRVRTVDALFAEAEKAVRQSKLADAGDKIVVVAGDPREPLGVTNLLKVQYIGRTQQKTS